MDSYCHALELLYSGLKSSANGLSSKEAQARLAKYGHNAIAEKDRRQWLDILRVQLTSPLLLLLFAAAIIAGAFGEVIDALIIMLAIALSAALGFWQEYKSEKVLSHLKSLISNNAVALRDGDKSQIDSRNLVLGDIIYVGEGDIVPADVRIIESSGILVDESVLTGESAPVSKGAASPSKACTQPQSIKNGLFMGTTIVGGQAACMVVACGADTFFGKTVSIFSSKIPHSDFENQMEHFGKMLIWIVFVLTAFVFATNFLLQHGENPFIDSALFALAIAVGIAPEALPAVVSISLAQGSMALARHKVVVKKLIAIEDLGDMDVLCTDKTGTLTLELELEKFIDLDEKDSHDVLKYALVCNTSYGRKKLAGNSVDVAIRKYALSHRINYSSIKKLCEIPFDFERRRMGAIAIDGKKRILIVKGGTESVLSACSKIRAAGRTISKKSSQAKEIIQASRLYSSMGYTTLAVAYKEISKKAKYTSRDEGGLTLIGFLLLKNPPKPTVKNTLLRLEKLNVALKILTGDSGLVAQKLCNDLGMKILGDEVILGDEIGRLGKKELLLLVEKHNVFARLSPSQKMKIIEALKANGHVVGYLGDGINDAPALRCADVGISVNNAADVAKGASHIVLLQKSLAVICDGIEGGRRIFSNIIKYILNTMSANQGNMLTVAIASIFLPFLPMLPIQILLLNIISDIPMLAISSDNADKHALVSAQKWSNSFILKFMAFFGVISAVFDGIFLYLVYVMFNSAAPEVRTGWYLYSILSEILILFSLRTRLFAFSSSPSKWLILFALGTSLLAIGSVYYAPFALLFEFVPLSVPVLLAVVGSLVAYFIATEALKPVFYRFVARGAGI
ncbi:MAG: magnesium-translocating P-type ATPase [Candidatus Micrarchaeota archaeon]